MKSIKIIVLLIFAIYILNSCKDEPTAVDNSNYLPTKQGSYWIYKTYIIDTLGNKTNAENPGQDSSYGNGQEMKLEKNSYVINTYSLINNTYQYTRKQNFYKENSKIYAFSDFFNDLFGINQLPVNLPARIKDSWLLIIDPSASSWKIYERDTSGVVIDSVPFLGRATANAKLTITAEKGNFETVSSEGKNYYALKFSYTATVKGGLVTASVPLIPIEFSQKINFWFSDGIGIVKMFIEPSKVPVPMLGNYPLLGSESTIIRYSIPID